MSNWKNPYAVARFGLTGALGLLADLSLKHWAEVNLSTPDNTGRMPEWDLIPGWLRLQFTDNHGAALGFFQGYRWMFLIVSVFAIVFLAGLFSACRKEQRGYQLILGLLLAGVMGNLFDRVCLGYVRDMIHVFPGRRFPDWIAVHLPAFWATPEWFPWIFNIADSFLCMGVTLMLIHGVIHGQKEKPTAMDAEQAT